MKTPRLLEVLFRAGDAARERLRCPHAGGVPCTVRSSPKDTSATLVNDVHSQLNATRVAAIVQPRNVDELAAAIADAHAMGHAVAVAGGRQCEWAASSSPRDAPSDRQPVT